jgi:gliding motility-associated-like protein
MKPTLLCCRNFAAVLLLFISFSAFAQLNPFTLTVTPTAQTCLGNGSLSFAVAGTTAGATISYEVYLLPNTTTYVATTNTTSVNSLSAGNYRVIAIQRLGALTNTQTRDVTIVNNIVPLQFSHTVGNVTCNNNGTITLNVTAGVASTYEILSGPMTRAPQTSNVFTGLAPGVYRIRIFDSCGEGSTRDITLTQVPSSMSIAPVMFAEGTPLPSCTTIEVANDYASAVGLNVIYPLTLTYTVFPPGGGTPTTVTTTIASGLNADTASAIIPFYYNQMYTYNLSIRDACGNIFLRNNNVVNQKLELEVKQDYPGCAGVMFTLTPSNYVGPYTVSFSDYPTGFIASAANPGHPSFTQPAPYGSEANPVPEGDYTVTLLDACGNSVTESFTLEYPPANPNPEVDAACGSATGSVKISFESREIVQLILQAAEPTYTGPVPADLSAGIAADGSFTFSNVPQGSYVFVITDNCGELHTLPVNIVPTAPVAGVTFISRAGCDEGDGSIRIFGPEGTEFRAANIIAAPAGFAVPRDITANINTTGTTAGQLYMNDLPEGEYTIELTDQCNFTQTQVVTVTGYHVTTNDITIVPRCGAFDINLQHTSNGNYAQSFWLQKQNETTGQWGHPQTGVVYSGGLPNATDSVILNVNQNNLNNAYTGHFRILKVFYVYSNGSAANFRCTQPIKEFDFSGGPEILDVTSFPCANGSVEAVVTVAGVPPFTYAITSMVGNPSFSVNNGNNNVFSGLMPGTYNFQITDNCNNVRNSEFTINSQQAITIAQVGFCEGEASTLSVPSYTFLSYQWYNTASPATILSTTATLNFPAYNSATEAGTYEVRIIASDPASCLNQVLSHTINPNIQPNAGTDDTVTICNTGTIINLANRLGGTFDAGGVWADVDSSGALTGNNFNTAGVVAGTYHFTYTVTGACATSDVATITVELKAVPVAPTITPVADVCVGANVQLTTPAISGAVYSWTGPNGFTSSLQNPLLSNTVVAQSGTYSLTVTVNGCTSPAGTVSFNVIPQPFAGADATDVQCNPGTVLDLFSYIGTGYTTGGTWTDLDASGALTAADFNTALVASGTFRFRYTVTSPCGVSDDATVTITLNATPNTPVISPLSIACAGSTVQLTAASSTAGVTYSWTGPNGFTSSLQNPTLTNVAVNQSGLYEVTATANGCTSPAASVTLTVSPLPNAGTDGTDTVCNSGSVIELATYLGTHDAGGTWTDVDGSGALASGSFNTSGIAPGVYHFKYDVTSLCGAVDDATVTITLNDIPNAPSVASVAPVCAGQDVQLGATAVAGAVYGWTGPNGFTSSLQNPLIAAATTGATGNYSVTVTVNGCTSPAATVAVTVKAVPDFSISGDATLCANQSTTLAVEAVNFNTSDAGFTYAWYEGTTLLAETRAFLSVTDFGTYSVEVSNGTCAVTKTFTVSLNPNPFDVEPISGCENSNYVIRVSNYDEINDIASVAWSGPNGFTASGEWVNITGGVPGTYTATVTQTGGCIVSQTVVVETTICNIPRGISPDGNLENDEFDLTYLDVKHLKIFNRYGLEVYDKADYKNEWHGQSSKGDLPTGTYFYVITLSEGKQVTGWVYLMRKV